jgi:hypothetical protein
MGLWTGTLQAFRPESVTTQKIPEPRHPGQPFTWRGAHACQWTYMAHPVEGIDSSRKQVCEGSGLHPHPSVAQAPPQARGNPHLLDAPAAPTMGAARPPGPRAPPFRGVNAARPPGRERLPDPLSRRRRRRCHVVPPHPCHGGHDLHRWGCENRRHFIPGWHNGAMRLPIMGVYGRQARRPQIRAAPLSGANAPGGHLWDTSHGSYSNRSGRRLSRP